MSAPRTGFFICHCGSNIAATVDVASVAEQIAALDGVVVSRDYQFMCSEPGQDLIAAEVAAEGVDRVVVAACSPSMHEPTFRAAVARAGLNPYMFQMVNVREHCSWIHHDRAEATAKAAALASAAVGRIAFHEPLHTSSTLIHPDTLVIGGGIAGIQAALDLAVGGEQVYLVEREPSIGGAMAKLDKTFPTLDCASCILTPKMVRAAQTPNLHILAPAEVESVDGFAGNFIATVRSRARYVTGACTSCQQCVGVCPVAVASPFDAALRTRTAIYKPFPHAIPNSFVIDKDKRPPCHQACPIGQEAAGYVALIAAGRIGEAARLIRRDNPLPSVCGRVCYHPCEEACNRQFVDDPIAIQALKRYALDWAQAHGEPAEVPAPAEERGERVAIIGSGPAGLACAHELAKRGYRPTVFEREQVVGGMLALGIPPYRLPERELRRDLHHLELMGVEFRTGVEFGRDVTVESLRADGFAAWFLATGAHEGIELGIPGQGLDGVVDAVGFLKSLALGDPQPIGRRVAVIGGGNCGIDAARSALRGGAEHVTVLYRRTRVEMPCEEHEAIDAEAEGIEFRFLTAPVEVLGEGGRMTGLRCVTMRLGEPDDTGRPRPIPIEGSEHEIEFDMVLAAIGQRPDLSYLAAGVGEMPTSPWGTLDADPESHTTPVDGVFAGGDAVTGPATVVAAMGAGKRSAEVIDKHLRGQPLTGFATHSVPAEIDRYPDRPHRLSPPYSDLATAPRQDMPKLDPAARTAGWDEVELGFSDEQAMAEAARCLNCGVCVDCSSCVDACLPGAIDHGMQDTVSTLELGQILVATGYSTFDAGLAPEYGYGRLPNVVTGIEFERMLSATGPTGGRVVCADGTEPKTVAIVHCVGSRDERHNKYCSRVCCMYALKFAHMVKERTGAEVYQFYIDMRAFGKGYEEFYWRVLAEGTKVVRGRVAEVTEAPAGGPDAGRLLVRAEDTLGGGPMNVPADMVILCTALQPAADAEQLRRTLHLSASADGFLLERHPKLEPAGTASDGIYIAGCAQGPKDIPDTVAQASAAASKMLGWIAMGELELEPIKAEVDEERCGGCRICNALCPYQAIEWVADASVARVVEALCKGCGTCVAACPAGAIAGLGFTDRQIYAEIEGLLSV